MPGRVGRGASAIRTPALLREYLAGRGQWPGDTPEEAADRPANGDFVARIHQRLKAYIRATSRARRRPYQWPRRHSFGALIQGLTTLGLVERTGRTTEPENRGAGRLGTARGFSSRTWIRLTPGSQTRDEWADPIGYLSRIYPNIRPAERELPTAVSVAEPLAERRRRHRAPAPASEVTTELTRSVESLERRRQTLVSRLLVASEGATRVDPFQVLERVTIEFLADVRTLYPTEQYPAADEAVSLLGNCIRIFEGERELTQRRVAALRNCQSSARLVAESLTQPLRVPEEPVPVPARRRSRPAAAPVAEEPASHVPTITLPETWTSRSAPRLIRHLEELAKLDPELVMPEVERLKEAAENWRVAAEDAQEEEEGKDSPDQDRIDRLTERQELLEQLRDALDVEEVEPGETLDLENAIDILRGA